jgi:ribulose-5-phosphate 4-epimerase/fuculose-1-phosphate aldolase
VTTGRRQFLSACASAVGGAALTAATTLSASPGAAQSGGAAQPAASPGQPERLGGVPPVEDLVAANRILAMEGILDGFGHVSVRSPQNAQQFLLARSMPPALVTRADILTYDLDGRVVNGKDPGSYLERFIHGEIYRVRADVRAVVHCHAASLIPFAASDVPMRAMYHMAVFVAEGVPVFDIRAAAGPTDLLVRTPALGRDLAKTLGSKHAVLMRGHGAVVTATSIPNVVGRSIYLDVNARAQMQAIALGGKVTYVQPDEAKLRLADPNEYARAWDLWRLKVGTIP